MSLLTINQDNPTYLYLIDSGNSDNVYKIGISGCIDYRLDSIREDYNLPNATLLMSKIFPTRTQALCSEAELHKEYFAKWDQDYPGQEFFCLDADSIKSVKAYYQ